MISQHKSRYPSKLVSDNAKEYLSQPVQAHLSAFGCDNTTTVPHHPEMNALAERINLTLLNAIRAAFAHTPLPNH